MCPWLRISSSFVTNAIRREVSSLRSRHQFEKNAFLFYKLILGYKSWKYRTGMKYPFTYIMQFTRWGYINPNVTHCPLEQGYKFNKNELLLLLTHLAHFSWNCPGMDAISLEPTLVQVKAWCRQTTSPCWQRSMSPYGGTKPKWVIRIDHDALLAGVVSVSTHYSTRGRGRDEHNEF